MEIIKNQNQRLSLGNIFQESRNRVEKTKPGLFGIFNNGRQINFHIDEDTAQGPATITLTRSSGVSSTPFPKDTKVM